jgi:hypothetical protein
METEGSGPAEPTSGRDGAPETVPGDTETPLARRDLLPAGTEFGGYLIEAVIGEGGMGVVYRAHQPRLDRRVALKLIASSLAADPEFRRRFERESRLAAAIDHPNVIPVYEAGEVDGQLFIVMRLVEGADLGKVIAAEGRVEPRRAARLVRQLGAALDVAHERGLVHRDIKPGNVLIEGAGDEEIAYLTDFGLTKDTSSDTGLTQTGHFVGTADYVAPEQARGERVDARTDVYALGCVLFESVTGEVPFPRPSTVAKIFAHVNDPVPMPSQRAGKALAPFDEVCRRALAKDPAHRFPSAGDLGRAATAAGEGRELPRAERSVARGEAAPQRRRSRLAVLAVAVLALGAIGGGLALALSGGSGSGSGEAPEVSDTEAITQTVSSVLEADQRDPEFRQTGYRDSDLVSGTFVTKLEQLQSLARGQGLTGLGFDPILCSQQLPTEITFAEPRIDGVQASVVAKFHFGEEVTPNRYTLTKADGTWRLDGTPCMDAAIAEG